MEAASSSETLVYIRRTKRTNSMEDHGLNVNTFKIAIGLAYNLKSRLLKKKLSSSQFKAVQ
jgi:hypothetical protein